MANTDKKKSVYTREKSYYNMAAVSVWEFKSKCDDGARPTSGKRYICLGPCSRPRAQFFPIWTSQPANNVFIFFLSGKLL